jgi:hypothetical protein
MGEIDETQQAKHDGQPYGQQEVDHPNANAVYDLQYI